MKMGCGNTFSHAEGGGGHKKFWVVFTQELDVLAILKGGARKQFSPFKRKGAKSFQPLIWGSEKFEPVLRGGETRNFLIVTPTPSPCSK